MSKIPSILLGLGCLLTCAYGADKVGVVMGPDGRVAGMVKGDGPVTAAELNGMLHEVGDVDPRFRPPASPNLIVAPPLTGVPPAAEQAAVPANFIPPGVPAETVDVKALEAASNPPVSEAAPTPPIVPPATIPAPPVTPTVAVVTPEPGLKAVPVETTPLASVTPSGPSPEPVPPAAVRPVVAFDFSARPGLPAAGAEAPEAMPFPLFEPNKNLLVILPGKIRPVEDGLPNPFDIRFTTVKPVQELKVRIGGVVMGRKPTAIINGKPFSRDERWGDFNVVRIMRDGVLLERDGAFVKLPRGLEVAIRLPN